MQETDSLPHRRSSDGVTPGQGDGVSPEAEAGGEAGAEVHEGGVAGKARFGVYNKASGPALSMGPWDCEVASTMRECWRGLYG